MRISARLLLLLWLLPLTGMRDPFQPPEDRCATGQLQVWRYQGIVSGTQTVGIVRDGQNHWRRVTQGDLLPTGWRIASLDETEMVINTGEGCEPQVWRWPREGTKKDETMDSRDSDDVQQRRSGRHAKTGNAGGG